MRQFNRFHGRGRTPRVRGFTPRRQVNEVAEVPEAKSNGKSDLDIVRLMEAYGLSDTSLQISLKRKVQVEDISVGVGIDIGFGITVNSVAKEFTMTVLHGTPIEYDVCTEWYTDEELKPISSHIGHHCIQMGANILTDWNIDALLQEPRTIHLIEIDSVTSDSVYTPVILNNEICHAKLDTGAQINVMTESLFRCIGKINKLPLYPKSDVKLVSYCNINIEYVGSTVVNVVHLNQTRKATFYVTKLNHDKVILGLWLCIDLLLPSVHCNDKYWYKAHTVQEAKKIDSEFPIGVNLKHTQHDQVILPPVPISTKLNSDDVKQQIMELYPDLFSGVGTIKNAMVHFEVKPRAVPVTCAPHHVPHAVQPKVKEELDRMLKL